MRSLVICAALLFAGCASTNSGFTPMGETWAAKPADHQIDIFKGDDLPDREFTEIARLDVHLETMGFVTRNFDEAEPELVEQAQAAGADGIIKIRENSSRYLENSMYHVSATAIRYSD